MDIISAADQWVVIKMGVPDLYQDAVGQIRPGSGKVRLPDLCSKDINYYNRFVFRIIRE